MCSVSLACRVEIWKQNGINNYANLGLTRSQLVLKLPHDFSKLVLHLNRKEQMAEN